MSELPKGWALINLFDICTPKQWKTISINQLLPSGYTVYGANGIIGFYNEYTHKKPTIMITCRGATCGNIHISKPFSYINGNAMALDELEEDACLIEYLGGFLSYRNFDDVVSGSAQPQITQANLKKVYVPLAPLNEQTRIVTKLEELLSELDAGVNELKTAQAKLIQYRQSLLKAAVEGELTREWRAKNSLTPTPLPEGDGLKLPPTLGGRVGVGGNPHETGAQLLERILLERRKRWEAKQLAKFAEQGKQPPKDWQKKYPEPVQPDTTDLPELPEGWVWASLDAMLDDINSGKSFKCEERPPTSDEIGVVKVSAVSWGEYNELESKTCQDQDKINPQYFVKAGDFLFSRANTIELVGACVIVKDTTLTNMLSDKILRFEFCSDEVKEWTLCFLRSKHGRKQIEQLASGNQESMRNIGQEKIRQIAVSIAPPIELQQANEYLKTLMDAALTKQKAIEQSLKQSAAQRKNILRAAFAGELVPQDPNDEPASVLLERIQAERAAQPKKTKGRQVQPQPE